MHGNERRLDPRPAYRGATLFTQASDEVVRLRNDLNVKQNALNAVDSFVNRLLTSGNVLYDMKWISRIEYNSLDGILRCMVGTDAWLEAYQ